MADEQLTQQQINEMNQAIDKMSSQLDDLQNTTKEQFKSEDDWKKAWDEINNIFLFSQTMIGLLLGHILGIEE